MNQPTFPGNSKRPPQDPPPEKKVEPVVVADAVARKKGLGRRLKEIMIGGDSRSVLQYVIADVVVPQVKDMISEALTQGFQRMIYGETSRRPSSRPGMLGSRYNTNYSQYAGRGTNPIGRAAQEERSPASFSPKGIEDIILATRVEADAVLSQMYDLLEKYDNVSIADLYAMIRWAPTHNDNKWGWLDLHGSDVKMVRGGGYVLVLPRPVPLD